MVVQIRIGIVACEIIKKEIEKVTANDPDVVHREYLEFALHVYPQEMRQKVIDTVNALEGKVDAVFIGYAVCQSLNNLPSSVKVPSVMLEGEDCIAAMLTPIEYAKEKGKCAGTWFSSPGWAEKGLEAVIKELHLDSMADQGYDPMYFAKLLFDGYSRCLYVDTGVGEREAYEAQSQRFADQLNLCHESREGNIAAIEAAWKKTKELAARTGASSRNS